MPKFRHLSEAQLQQLSDDDLIARIRHAREAGELDAAKLALAILVFGHMPTIQRRVALKLPPQDVEHVAANVMISAITSAFDGKSVGEFHSWLHTIAARRIADHYRHGRLDQVPLPEDHVADDQVWRETPAVEDETGAVAVEHLVEAVLAELSPLHREVVELAVFEQLSAADTAVRVADAFPNDSVSPDNVYKIAQRFRDRLREELERDDTS